MWYLGTFSLSVLLSICDSSSASAWRILASRSGMDTAEVVVAASMADTASAMVS